MDRIKISIVFAFPDWECGLYLNNRVFNLVNKQTMCNSPGLLDPPTQTKMVVKDVGIKFVMKSRVGIF